MPIAAQLGAAVDMATSMLHKMSELSFIHQQHRNCTQANACSSSFPPGTGQSVHCADTELHFTSVGRELGTLTYVLRLCSAAQPCYCSNSVNFACEVCRQLGSDPAGHNGTS